ncbi:E3 ubiquitin-protein ligase lubel-like [Cydia splendana]|uniref:E3 ubiquitin-protein ligase lubel-like n=1 Tax=Cydia splendana TaxID=1100963 RepID=UPI0028F47062
MAPDTIGDKAEELPQAHNAQVEDSTSAGGYPRASGDAINRSNEQWQLLMQTQNAQMMELIRMINANVGREPESALPITLPEFNPEEEGADAVAWCKVVDIRLGQYPLQGRALIIALSKSLKGSASTWLSQVTYEGMTWDEFKLNFLACYDSENTCAATMISINNSRPKEEESYAAYASRIVNSFLTKWKDLTPEQIAVSFVLAHISRFDTRVQRMAHMTDIMTREKLVQELSEFSYLKHKLQPNPVENNDLTPEKRVKRVPIERPARKRNSTKPKKATATSSKPAVDIAPEICYELQPNSDENVLKLKLVKSTISIERPVRIARKRKSTKPKTATATSSTPMDVMPEICYRCGEGGHNAIECPKASATALSEPEPNSSASAQSHVDSSKHDCVCCGGPQPTTRTLRHRQPETISHTDLLAGSSSAATNGTIYIEIMSEDKNQSNGEDVMPAVSRLESSSVARNNTIYIDTEANQDLINEEIKATDKYVEDINQNVIQASVENGASDVYAELVLLEQHALVINTEEIECGVCMDNYQPGQGAVLRECVHAFCKECLSDVVKHSEEPSVSCPAMGCPGFLEEREIRALVSPEEYERWLAKGLAAAESGARNAFHCRTADCQGWAMCDPDVKRFLCPVCDVINCVTCQAIHENETCEEYRAKQKSDEKTKTYLDNLLSRGEAMQCPECSVIITKQLGCDWIKCTACRTEICWATRGRRWGPGGRGDTSGGCQCRVKRKKCHPSCRDCH